MKALPSTQLVQSLTENAERYERLRKLFEEFCNYSAWLTTQRSPIKGIKHFPDLVNNAFEIEFGGQRFRFEFGMDHKSGKGIVSCKIPGKIPLSQAVDIGSFRFVGSAESDVSGPENDPLCLNTTGDAAHLVLAMIHQGLEQLGQQ